MITIAIVIVTCAVCGFIHNQIVHQNKAFDLLKKSHDELEVRDLELSELQKHESWIEDLETKERFYVVLYNNEAKPPRIAIPSSDARQLSFLSNPYKRVYRGTIRWQDNEEVFDFFFKIKKTYTENEHEGIVFLTFKELNNLQVLKQVSQLGVCNEQKAIIS